MIFLALMFTVSAILTKNPAFLVAAGIMLMLHIAGSLLDAAEPKKTNEPKAICASAMEHEWIHKEGRLVCGKCGSPHFCPPHQWKVNEQNLLVCEQCKKRPNELT